MLRISRRRCRGAGERRVASSHPATTLVALAPAGNWVLVIGGRLAFRPFEARRFDLRRAHSRRIADRRVPAPVNPERGESYGETGLTPVDRLGVWLSMRALRRHLPDGPLDVLDLGCGYEVRALRDLGDRVRHGIGVDVSISPDAAALPNLRLEAPTIEEALPAIPDSSQDAVLAISVIEHLWDPLTALAGAPRVLRPGGLTACFARAASCWSMSRPGWGATRWS